MLVRGPEFEINGIGPISTTSIEGAVVTFQMQDETHDIFIADEALKRQNPDRPYFAGQFVLRLYYEASDGFPEFTEYIVIND